MVPTYGPNNVLLTNLQYGTCSAANSATIVENSCLGQRNCTISAGDPPPVFTNIYLPCHTPSHNAYSVQVTLILQSIYTLHTPSHNIFSMRVTLILLFLAKKKKKTTHCSGAILARAPASSSVSSRSVRCPRTLLRNNPPENIPRFPPPLPPPPYLHQLNLPADLPRNLLPFLPPCPVQFPLVRNQRSTPPRYPKEAMRSVASLMKVIGHNITPLNPPPPPTLPILTPTATPVLPCFVYLSRRGDL